MNQSQELEYLERKPSSFYRQLFVKDRWVAARTLYGQTMGDDARSAAQVAVDYGLPVEVVLEAIRYCESCPPEIRDDWEREEMSMLTTSTNAVDGCRKLASSHSSTQVPLGVHRP